MTGIPVLSLILSVYSTFVFAFEQTYSARGYNEPVVYKPNNLIIPEKMTTIPAQIKNKFFGVADKPLQVYSIDLNCDNRKDYIVIGLKYGDEINEMPGMYENQIVPQYSYFVDSKFKIRSKEYWVWEIDGFDYRWFAKLDNGPMLYMFHFVGDSDSSDYRLKRINGKTWEFETVFEIEPLIKAIDDSSYGNKNDIFWGYPWDIKDLILKKQNGLIKMFSAVLAPQNDPRRAKGAYSEGLKGVNAPYVFFTGLPTQGEPITGFKNLIKYSTVKEISGSYNIKLEKYGKFIDYE